MGKVNQYLLYSRIIQEKLWFKIAIYFWCIVSIYDQLLSQFIPEKISQHAPKAWEVTIMMGNLLPFWGWLLILAAILVFASFEFGIRQIHQQKVNNKTIPNNAQIKYGYADFIRLCNVNDDNNWEDGFKIKTDGVWKVPLKKDADATKEERAVLNYHHLNNFSKPCLPFPFSLEQFNEFIENYGMTGYIDQCYLENLKIKEQNKLSPLEIIFDPTNPAHRFWSMESSNRRAFWEYRVEIKNRSLKTITNVSLTKEHIGQMGKRPVDQIFDKIKKTSCDLKPGCRELVPVIHWPIQILPGMLANSTALEYGPVMVTASGDDVLPTTRIFRFNWQQIPMIFD